MASMLDIVLSYLVPLRSIAQSLDKLAKLYEADLESRNIYLVTEEPKESDTEIWYGDDEQNAKRSKKKFGKSDDWFNQEIDR